MDPELRPDKYVCMDMERLQFNNIMRKPAAADDGCVLASCNCVNVGMKACSVLTRHKGCGQKLPGFVMSFGEGIRHNQYGIEVSDTYPEDIGTLIVTNFRVFWLSHEFPGRNISIGYDKVIAIGREKLNVDEPDETQVVSILTFDMPFHKEFQFRNCLDVDDLYHIKSIMDIFRSYTTTKPYREVMINSNLIEDGELNMLDAETVSLWVDSVKNMNNIERPCGTFVITNLRSIWFADSNYDNNIAVPYLCVEKVNILPCEYGEAFDIEVIQENRLYAWRFNTEPEDKHQYLLANFCDHLLQYKDSPYVGF